MRVAATSVKDYLAHVPLAHREPLAVVYQTVARHLPAGYEEGLQYGVVSWFVPPERYPWSYNGQPLSVAALASQKNYMALYLHGAFGMDADQQKWLAEAFAAAGKKLDMGKSCLRFRSLEDLPLPALGQFISRFTMDKFLAGYERAQDGRKQKPVVRQGQPKGAAAKAKPAGKAAA
ncbi:MAG TPA: DUF1801 domain-containing protein, partial [Kofleriaceae bacterium]|nr:DUF1801 domain-containing protein [Kofleriaceae bacterium]